MARTTRKLTALAVTRAGPGFHADGNGLYLKVREGGTRSWVFRFQLNGRERYAGLGAFPLVSLSEARDAAFEARRGLRAGVDPIEQRRASRAAARPATPTFRQVADQVIAQRAPTWKNGKSRATWELSLLTYCKPLHHLAVDQVTTQDVLKIIRPIWADRAETGNRVRQRIEIVLSYASAHGHIPDDRPNAARWKHHLQYLLTPRAEIEHHAAMPYAEVPAFMAALAAMNTPATLCLRFLILCAVRSGEARGARWSEIDLERSTWTIPGSRMKAGRQHVVPLSGAALEVLRQAAEVRRTHYVFPGWKHGAALSDMAFTKLLPADCTTHGFRSSFKDFAIEQTDFPNELSEMCLAHSVGSAIERAYRRQTAVGKRRDLMEAWATWCMCQNVAGNTFGNAQVLASNDV